MFQHSLVELSTAVKGFALIRLLAQQDCSSVLYFDPDIVVLAPLDGLLEDIGGASILLTPHLAEPEVDDGRNTRQRTLSIETWHV